MQEIVQVTENPELSSNPTQSSLYYEMSEYYDSALRSLPCMFRAIMLLNGDAKRYITRIRIYII